MSINDEINHAEAVCLQHFTVCIRHGSSSMETFPCWAENEEHADEQARNAYPESDIIGSVVTTSIENPYYNQLEHDSEDLAIVACAVVQNWEEGDLASQVALLDTLLDELQWFDRDLYKNNIST